MSRVQYLWKKKMMNTLMNFGLADGLLSLIERYFDGEIDEAQLQQITKIPAQSVSPALLIQLYDHYEQWKQVHDHQDYQRLIYVLAGIAGRDIVHWLAPDALKLFQWTLDNWLNERMKGLDFSGIIQQLYLRNPEWFVQYAQTVPDDQKWLMYAEMISRDPDGYPHLGKELQEKQELHIRFYLEQHGYTDSAIDSMLPLLSDGNLNELKKCFRQKPLQQGSFVIEQRLNVFLISAYQLFGTDDFYKAVLYTHFIVDENRSIEHLVRFLFSHYTDRSNRNEHLLQLRNALFELGFGITWVRWLLKRIQDGDLAMESLLANELQLQPETYHSAMIGSYGLDYVLLYQHCYIPTHPAKSTHKLERSFSDELLAIFSRKLGERRQTYIYAFLAGRWPLDLLMDRLRHQLPANIGSSFPFERYMWMRALIPQFDRAVQLLWMGEDYKSLLPVCERFVKQEGFEAWCEWLETLQVTHAQQLSICLQASFGQECPALVAASSAWVEDQWRNHHELITTQWSAYSVKARVHLISLWMEYDRERMGPKLELLTQDRSKRVQKLMIHSLPDEYAEWTSTPPEPIEPVKNVQPVIPLPKPVPETTAKSEDIIIARKNGERGRPKKIVLDWIPWQVMPTIDLIHSSNHSVSPERVREWVILFAKAGTIEIPSEAEQLTLDWNKTHLQEFVWQLFMLWIRDGAETKKKWVMGMAVVFGDDRVIQVLLEKIDEWPRHARGTIASEAMRAMVMTNRDSVMVQLASIAHQSKIRQVRDSARAVLEDFAKQNGYDQEAFQDRLIPDHGFNRAREKIVNYGSRTFRVKLNQDLQFDIFDAWNKPYRTLPYPAKTDDVELSQAAWEEMKQLRKQLPLTISKQQQRILDTLVFPRFWTYENWKHRFALHPIMHSFATGLLWGWYLDGKLQAPFLYPINENVSIWPEQIRIGIVHPIELTADQLKEWQTYRPVNEACQPIQQLTRNFMVKQPELADVDRFRGLEVKGTRLKTHLEARGWQMGSLQERGQIFTFYRENEQSGIGVQLTFSGMKLAETHQSVTLESLRFYQAGMVVRGHYCTDDILPEYELTRQQLPLRTWCELIYDVQSVLE